ncbi:MAG: FeoA family protein [Pseudomonadota bacterium]
MVVKLADTPLGTHLRVVGYRNSTSYTLRLQSLGLVPGTQLQLIRRAPLGDPIEIRLRGYSLALRPSEADDLELQVIDSV